MIFIKAVNPTIKDTHCFWILESIHQLSRNDAFIVILDDEERSLTIIFVADGDFSCHNVGQSVNKGSWAWKIIIWVLYGCLIGGIGL